MWAGEIEREVTIMKKITRTIEVITGIAVTANFATRTFEEKPFTVYDDSDIPENAQNITREQKLFVISVEDFMKYAKQAKEGDKEC